MGTNAKAPGYSLRGTCQLVVFLRFSPEALQGEEFHVLSCKEVASGLMPPVG